MPKDFGSRGLTPNGCSWYRAQPALHSFSEEEVELIRLAGLALALEHLGVPRDTDTLQGRVRLQKSIFLAQQAGVNLDYRFGWYLRGPYSPALTRDYFALSTSTAEDSITGYRLTDEARDSLDALMPLFTVPAGVNLRQDQWLELAASWLYLKQVSRLSDEKARSLIQKQKANLVPYLGRARQALSSVGLAA
jgi:uncharacterized protein YwgA